MNPKHRAERRGFSRLLRDPRVYKLEILQYEDIRRVDREYTKRKYSVEMRQKATIREKNRIQSIGREFYKLAKLLPDSNGIKRSHQKILHDTVAYIRALEVELKIIDEKKLLEKWSMKKDGSRREGRNDWKNNCFAEEVAKSKIKRGAIELYSNGNDSDQCTGDISPSYDYLYNEIQQENQGRSFINCQDLLQNLDNKKDKYCNKLQDGKKSGSCEKDCTNAIEIKEEVFNGHDEYGIKSEKSEIQGCNESVDKDIGVYISHEDDVSFEKIVTGLNFHL